MAHPTTVRQARTPHTPLSPDAIKAAAREEMAEHGTAGLTLRGTARRLGVTAPAIYNYFPRLDDLITAITVDALDRLGETLRDAECACTDPRTGEKVLAICRAHRAWALTHPGDFQLSVGDPIPGYEFPRELAGSLGRRPFLGLFELFRQAHEAGELTVPEEYVAVPPTIAVELAAWRRESGLAMPDALVCLLASGWARITGMVVLELFGQIQGLIGEAEAFFDYELRAFARRLGLALADPEETAAPLSRRTRKTAAGRPAAKKGPSS